MPHDKLSKRVPLRAKQLRFALFTRYKKEHIAFARKYLSIKELALFDRLPRFEKKHAVQVARHILKLAYGNPKLNERKLAKIALLHDIGKAATKLTIFDKVVLVVLRRYLRPLYDRLAEKGRREGCRSYHRKSYVHKYHDQIGAAMLKRAGVDEEIVKIVGRHTDNPTLEDSLELKLLKEADSIY